MRITFKFPRSLLINIHHDLDRPHKFAAERVGFVSCEYRTTQSGDIELLAQEYHPVEDDYYIDDSRVGAMMGSSAIRAALQFAYQKPVSMFHIHRHEHRGIPKFSFVDTRENSRFIPDFWKVRSGFPHGAIVLSFDSMIGMCWVNPAMPPVPIGRFEIPEQQASNLRGIA
jgi:hypothetical protein